MTQQSHDNLVYKIFGDALAKGSLPKYIFFNCPEESLCRYVKDNSSATNRKLLRYLKKLKEQKLESHLRHSEARYFDILFNETIDVTANADKIKKELTKLINEMSSNIFYMSDLDSVDKLIEETIMLLLDQYTTFDNNMTQTQLINLIKSISKNQLNFTNFDDLLFLLEMWRNGRNEAKEKIEDGLFRIQEVNKALEEYKNSISSELIYKQITYTASVRSYVQVEGTVVNYSLNKFTKEEYVWLFDSFVINNNLSIVQYNQEIEDNVMKYIKFDSKNLKLINSAKTNIVKNSKGRYIYCYVPQKDHTFLNVYILLVPSILEFKIDLEQEEAATNYDKEIINTLSQNTPIIVGELIETKLSATFRIFGTTIDNTIFIDMLLNDDIMNTYLYLDERVTFWSEKKRLILHMKSVEYTYLSTSNEREDVSTELIAMITQIESDKLARFKLQESEIMRIEPGDTYLEVNIIRSISRVAIYRFYDIITKLLTYYSENRSLVEKEYLKIFPNMKFAKFKEGRKQLYQRKEGKQKAKREILKFYAPDVFITGSPRLCQKNRQPIVLETDQDIEEFQKKTFTYKDTVRNREVLQFPKDNPKYNFGCDYEKLPFIGVKKSNLPNSATYPYIPCCFEKPQMDQDVKSAYHDYYSQIQKNVGKSKHVLITDKLVEYESFGYVNRKLENLFNKFFEEDTLLRFGVVRSHNSFLHCILVATRDPNYLQIKDPEERELYVRDMKLLIFNDLNYTLGKQEMFDYTEGEIYQYLLSDNTFLDPKLAFRYLEEYFQINIFTFKYKRNTETNSIDIELEIPRHKLFHSRLLRKDRPTVLILKNSEKISNKTVNSCELILVSKYTDLNEATLMFGPEITEYIFSVFQYVNNTKIWGFSDSMYLLEDTFLYTDFKLGEGNITHQFIDENGKRFGYLLDSGIIVMTSPTVPLDLPVVDYDNLNFPNYQDVLKVFDNPSSYSVNDAGVIDGLWFEDNNFWVPIQKVDKINKFFSYLSVGPQQSYFIKNIKFIEATHEKRIILSIIMNTIIKIIQITNIYDTEMLFEEYVQLNSKLQNYRLNTSFFTNMFVINHVEPYLEAVDTIVSNLIINHKIQIYDKKLYYDLIYFTNLYVKNTLVQYKEWRPNVMDFYKYEENFSVSNFVKVIIGEDKLLSWIDFEVSKKNRNIQNRILTDDTNLILFRDDINNKYFMVQRAKSIIQAINICTLWVTNSINNGLDTIEDQLEGVNYDRFSSYQVSLFGELEPVTEKKSTDYKLLFRGENVYSLLELPN